MAKRRKFLRANARSLVLLGIVITGLLLGADRLLAAMGSSPTQRAFQRGLFVGLVVGLAWMLISTTSGHYAISAGADAEAWTSRELRRFRKTYRSIDNIEFSGFDVDHVVIGPAGVFAVESKWTSQPWVLTSHGMEGLRHDPIRQAQEAAQQIHLFLNTSKKLSLPVKPVLVIWGPGRPALRGELALIRGVTILTGNEKAWSKLLAEQGPLSADEIDRAFGELARFVKTRVDYEWKESGRRLPPLASTILKSVAVFGALQLAIVGWALVDVLTK